MNYPVSEARDRLGEIINKTAFGKERCILLRHGKPLVAIVPIEDLQKIESSNTDVSHVLQVEAK